MLRKRRGLPNRPQSPSEILSHPVGEELRLGVCALAECMLASPTVEMWQGFGSNCLDQSNSDGSILMAPSVGT